MEVGGLEKVARSFGSLRKLGTELGSFPAWSVASYLLRIQIGLSGPKEFVEALESFQMTHWRRV